MITIKKLSKKYGSRTVLDNIDLSLPRNGLVLLYGASGSGKSTLLNAIGGIERSYNGSIEIKNTCISRLNDDQMRIFRIQNIGYVFQNFNLLNLETVYENIALPLDSVSNQNKRIKKRRIIDVMNMLDIRNLAKKNINKLSGGEKQRVAIARAIINSPSILLCDEPTGALDNKNSQNVYEILKKLSANILIIIASHDPSAVQYANQILKIKDGIIETNEQKEIAKENERRAVIGNRFRKRKPELPLRFHLHHAFQRMKSKKFRTMITNGILSLSLTGIGVSTLLSSGISSKIQEAFSSLTNGKQITVSLKHENSNIFGGVFSASEQRVKDLSQRYKNYVDGYGVSYLVNFEDFFKDQNDFYFPIRGEKYFIKSLSTRSINDYRWLNNDTSITYPYSIYELNTDEVVLGLNYVDVVNLCYKLQIQRSYSSLGNYIRSHDLFLNLEVMNTSWQYEDEQTFLVKGIKESNKSCIYHSSSLWNQTVFEKMMLLPSNDGETAKYPWEMYKIYFLKSIEDAGTFIDRLMRDKDNHDYVFERTNNYYHPSLCKIGEVCSERRVLVFLSDKYAINTGIINDLANIDNRLTSFYYLSNYGYSSYASNVLNGFSKNAFISLDESKIEDAIDADTMNNDNGLTLSLPNGVINGNYLNSLGDGFHFSSRMENLLIGRSPNHLNEIVISSGLNQKFGGECYGKELYYAGLANETYYEDETIEKEYRQTKMIIVGIVDEDKDYIYHYPNWTISFFRDQLGISMFNLTPSSVVFELDDDVDQDSLCEEYNKLFKELNFTSPSEDLTSSINSTLKYANIILLAFSLISTIISVLLLGTIIMLNVLESESEISLFTYLGIRQKDINLNFVYQALSHGLIAIFFANIEIVLVDLAISYSLKDMLKTSFIYSFNPFPFIVTFSLGIFLCLFVSFIVTKYLLIKKGKKDKA